MNSNHLGPSFCSTARSWKNWEEPHKRRATRLGCHPQESWNPEIVYQAGIKPIDFFPFIDDFASCKPPFSLGICQHRWTLRCCYILTWHMRSLERVSSDGDPSVHIYKFIYLFMYLWVYKYYMHIYLYYLNLFDICIYVYVTVCAIYIYICILISTYTDTHACNAMETHCISHTHMYMIYVFICI